MIVYYNCSQPLYHLEDKKPRYAFSFLEGIADIIYNDNPNSIVIVTYYYNKNIAQKISNIADKYNIKNIIVSGWSAGGNHAIEAIQILANKDRNIQLLLMDCNHTNYLNEKYIETLAKYNIPIHYTSNVMGKAKNKVLRNIMKYQIPITFYQLQIEKDFSGSNHMHCRDCAVSYNLYGYILGTAELNENYRLGYYDYNLKENIF